MNAEYIQNLRYKLQKRVRRLNSMEYQVFHFSLKQFQGFLKSYPIFVGILDDLERSVESAKSNHQDYQAFVKGIEMVMNQIHGMLKKNDVKPIDVDGKTFDPHYHEVLMQEESEHLDEGMVIEAFQKGYCLGEKVVRTAKVKVAKKKE